MLALDKTTLKLEVVLGGAISTNQAMCTVVAKSLALDENDADVVTNQILTNGATAVTLLAAPTQSVQQEIQNITIYNADTASITATVRLNDGTNTWTLFKTTMVTLGTLVYEKEAGWVNYSAAGARS